MRSESIAMSFFVIAPRIPGGRLRENRARTHAEAPERCRYDRDVPLDRRLGMRVLFFAVAVVAIALVSLESAWVAARPVRRSLAAPRPLPLLVASALAVFTTASPVIVVLSIFFTLGLVAVVRLPVRAEQERLAAAALIEIEHALAETDEAARDEEHSAR